MKDLPFAFSPRNRRLQNAFHGFLDQHNQTVTATHDNVAGPDRHAPQLHRFVQRAKPFFLASADCQPPAEDWKRSRGDGFDVPHRSVNHKPRNAPGLSGYREHLAPGACMLASLRVSNQHHAGLRNGNRMMQHEIVASRAAHGHGLAANTSARPHRPDFRVHHTLQSGRLIEGGGVKLGQLSDALRRNSHGLPFAGFKTTPDWLARNAAAAAKSSLPFPAALAAAKIWAALD